MTKKLRIKIPQETKVRAQLQQEINSICPFCGNNDVGHFQIHHIDENPKNNLYSNLILICANCHSKITKGDISHIQVEKVKSHLPNKRIEIVNIGIDSRNCSWTSDNIPNVFLDHISKKSPFPILDFSFINHSKQTILLTAIKIKVKHLSSPLSGIPTPMSLKSFVKYKISLPLNDDEITHQLDEQLQIPAEQAFRFQIELYEKWMEETYELDGRTVIYFIFLFGAFSIKAPKIFLNCKDENEKMNIVYLD